MSSAKYDHKKIEKKWQEIWHKQKTYQPDLLNAKKPFYNLMMFPYPSAEGLHVGNMYAFTGADVFGRFKRMQGYDVFEPIGLDGFGIHSENYAIKIGTHPKLQAKVSEKHFYEQLHAIGNGFSWDQKLETYNPDYYKWTQWLFIQMYKNGLAYRKKAMVNFCPSCKTVLADEQVETGFCERCKSEVERRETEQWFFKITAYADKLLEGIEKIDWPKKIKIAQRQWIGKNKGLSIQFTLEEKGIPITIWTKYWETVFGTTFIVVAPEHPIVKNILQLITDEKVNKTVTQYIADASKKTEQQRKKEQGNKTGVPTGIYAKNPVNGNRVPIWIADYVLMNVGTGAVMGVPAHDERDFDFAKKYALDIVQVVSYENAIINRKVKNAEMSFEGEGVLVNSGQFNGKDAWGEGKRDMAIWMIRQGYANWQIHYHLRDWLISRQRYWGPPIPMINCKKCGWQSVNEKDLPVFLPDILDWKPKGDGKGPLENASSQWLYTKCPQCGEDAKRETDVSDTFLDSSWYFLRYPSMHDSSVPFDSRMTKKWLPVNVYIGGAEHAVLHLLYSRFVWMCLHDWKLLPDIESSEPFPFLFSHGLIVKDGAKMSKSKGNVVIPDAYIEKFGADTLRAYLMFLGPYDQGGDFRDSGIAGMKRFLDKIWAIFTDQEKMTKSTSLQVRKQLHKTIQAVTNDILNFKYNTALSRIMEFINILKLKNETISNTDAVSALKLLAPFAPHMTEELFQLLRNHKSESKNKNFISIHTQKWPTYSASLTHEDEIIFIVQVNGKVRDTFKVNKDKASLKFKMIKQAKECARVIKYINGKTIKKEIFVPGKLVNFVI